MSEIVTKTWGPGDNYGPQDLNRVEQNTQIVADLLESAGYKPELEPIKTDRDESGYEFSDSLSRVERNIDSLAKALFEPPGYQQPKEWAPGMAHNYDDVNRLERNLELLNEWGGLVIANFKRCGTFTCGEDGDIY